MTEAFERGDYDEASRQGALAGPVAVERALANPVRATKLAAIVAASHTEDRAELLPALAELAGSPDRRVAIPAATAAREIARELARHELPDDLASDDITTWRELVAQQTTGPHFIEVRVLALDTLAALAHVLAPDDLGYDLASALRDPDPAFRAAAIALVPRPTPDAARGPLANAVIRDADAKIALAAASALCGDDRAPALPLLGSQGLDRIKVLIKGKPAKAVRDAARCLKR